MGKETAKKEKKIRFTDTSSGTLFELPDNGTILVKYPDGTLKAFECSYLDAQHFMVGIRAYRAAEFAEKMEKLGAVFTAYREREETGHPARNGSKEGERYEKGIFAD